jgi:hypothetical protein
MHYYSPRGVLHIQPVEAFTARYPAAQVTRVGAPSLTLDPAALPSGPQIMVLEQSR